MNHCSSPAQSARYVLSMLNVGQIQQAIDYLDVHMNDHHHFVTTHCLLTVWLKLSRQKTSYPYLLDSYMRSSRDLLEHL